MRSPTRHPPSPRFRLRPVAALAALLALALPACATNPVTGKTELTLISTAEEMRLGEKGYGPARQSQGGDWAVDPALSEYVNGVGLAIARMGDRPDLPYEFVVLNNPVPNAWALPGGKVAVNRGLLTELESEAELAAVLAHEIVHAAARHGARQLERDILLNLGSSGVAAAVGGRRQELVVGAARVGATLVKRRYSRDEELEADRYGMTYMARAGYDPAAAVNLQETFVRLSEGGESGWLAGLLATHPPSPERVEANRRTMASLPPGGELGVERYRQAVAPLLAAAPAYALSEEGEAALADGDADTALARARAAIDIEPREAAFFTLSGRALAEAERWDEAEAAFDEAVRLNPGHFHPWLLRGLARKARDEADGARADLERSLELLPTATAHLNLGEVLLAGGDPESAKYHLRQAAKAGGNTGRQAAETLVRLEIAEVPGRYVAVGVGVRPDGYLYLIVENLSPLPVRDLTVAVTLPDTGAGPIRADFTFDGPFRPRQRTRRDTSYGPLPQAAGVGARAVVTHAALAE